MAGKWPTVATDADLYVAVNELQNNLASAVDAVVTTLPLNSATGFPTVGLVLIDNEVIKYTGISTNSLTGCTRAFDGTTAAAHSSSAVVSFAIMAAHHNVIKDEIEAIEADLANVLTAITGASPASTAASIYARFQQMTQQIKNALGTTNWYDAVGTSLAATVSTANTALATANAALPTTGGTMSGAIAMGAHKVTGLANGSASDDAAAFGQLSSLLPLAGGTLTGNLAFSPTTKGIVGTTTNDSAAAGNVGEYKSSLASGTFSAPGATNVASISLTAGDWDVTVVGYLNAVSGTTYTTAYLAVGFTGETQTTGNNFIWMGVPTTTTQAAACIANYRESLASTTTINCILNVAYTGSNPGYAGRISARRIR